LRTYELLFIVAPTEPDEAVDALIEQLRSIATERGAEVAKVDRMGRRRLAYSIRRAANTYGDGFYVVMTFNGSGTEIAELERRLRVTETVIRHMTVRIDEDLKRAEKFRAKRQAKGRVSRRPRSAEETENAAADMSAVATDAGPEEES
jgi:small subunit ribosomal protein S6